MKNSKQVFGAFCLVTAAVVAMLFFTECTAADQKKWANSALDAQQFACVIAMELTDEAAIASICHISDELRPVLRSILAAKLSAKNASMSHDAGRD